MKLFVKLMSQRHRIKELEDSIEIKDALISDYSSRINALLGKNAMLRDREDLTVAELEDDVRNLKIELQNVEHKIGLKYYSRHGYTPILAAFQNTYTSEQ